MERGRCEFWPLSRPTYKMYSVEAGSLLKCHTSSFCISKPRIRLQTRPTARLRLVLDVIRGQPRVPWTPSEEKRGKGAPLWLNFNPNISGSPTFVNSLRVNWKWYRSHLPQNRNPTQKILDVGHERGGWPQSRSNIVWPLDRPNYKSTVIIDNSNWINIPERWSCECICVS